MSSNPKIELYHITSKGTILPIEYRIEFWGRTKDGYKMGPLTVDIDRFKPSVKAILYAKESLQKFYTDPTDTFRYYIDSDIHPNDEVATIVVKTEIMEVRIKLGDLLRNHSIFEILFPK